MGGMLKPRDAFLSPCRAAAQLQCTLLITYPISKLKCLCRSPNRLGLIEKSFSYFLHSHNENNYFKHFFSIPYCKFIFRETSKKGGGS